MEKYSSHQHWPKNRLKKEEEIFLMVILFFIGVFFLYKSISIDKDNSAQITSLTAYYRQFSIIEHAYAANNHE